MKASQRRSTRSRGSAVANLTSDELGSNEGDGPSWGAGNVECCGPSWGAGSTDGCFTSAVCRGMAYKGSCEKTAVLPSVAIPNKRLPWNRYSLLSSLAHMFSVRHSARRGLRQFLEPSCCFLFPRHSHPIQILNLSPNLRRRRPCRRPRFSWPDSGCSLE